MHTCLSLSNIGGHWYVERALANLLAQLQTYCDSIEWCNVALAGPSGDDAEHAWRVDLKLRIFDETVRANARVATGPDAQQSLTEALADVYASATTRITQIAKQHQGCCCHRAGRDAAASKASA